MASLPLILSSSTVSDIGYVRHDNQDSSFAGEHLVTVCDGMGGHAGGDTASTIAIRSLAHIEGVTGVNPNGMADMMVTSIIAAHDAIVGKAKRERKLAGMGTTVVALRMVDDFWVLAHIGDSRAYLLREGKLIRGTKDHSYVQHLVDTGRITPEQAKSHSQRNVVMRVLGDFDIDPRPDVSIRTALPGDRWMLCSDGLCGVLEDATIHEVLLGTPDLQKCAQKLVSMALKAGSTDNVTIAIVEAHQAANSEDATRPHQVPLLGGAASKAPQPIADIIDSPVAIAPPLRENEDSPASRAAALAHTRSHADSGSSSSSSSAGSGAAEGNERSRESKTEGSKGSPADKVLQITLPHSAHEEGAVPETGEIPIVQKANGILSDDPHDPQVKEAVRVEASKAARKAHKHKVVTRIGKALGTLLLIAALALGAMGTYRWFQQRYYLGEADGVVAIYRGVPTNIFGFSLSRVEEKTDIQVSDLPSAWQDQLERGISVDSLAAAYDHIKPIEKEAKANKANQSKKTTASPSPSGKRSPSSKSTSKS